MTNDIQEVSLDLIYDPMTPMRKQADNEKLEELANSIKSVGLIQPVTLRKVGEKYEVVAGHRRVLASRIAGLVFIRAVVLELSDEQSDTYKVHENLYREDVNPVDEARFIHHLIERYGYNPEQLSNMLGKSKAYLIARHDLLSFPDYLIEALEKKQVKLTAAQWLARITNDRLRQDYTRFAIVGGITAKRAEAWFKSWDAGQLPDAPEDAKIEETERGAEQVPLLMPCVICRLEDKLENMGMYYAHVDCVTAIRK